MSAVLGLDTSNYTTSAALYADGCMAQVKRLIPVKPGEKGVRQSDALFHHVRQLPELVEELRRQAPGDIAAVAASDRPQQADGSYMPCFLAGIGAARTLGAVMGLPVYAFTHQQGHVAAALYSAGCMDWMDRPFLAFHVSGGTTDALLVEPDEAALIRCTTVARSLDLKAGQLIDRVGVMLGLAFPAGPALEQLALQATGRYAVRPTLEAGGCHLSGVENQCRDRLQKGEPPEEIARFCLMSVLAAISGMSEALLREHPGLPILYAGGVMSNTILRRELEERFGGRFAEPVYAADNAAGIALLGHIAHARAR